MEFKDPAGHSSDNCRLSKFYAELLFNIPLYDRWYLEMPLRYITKGTNLAPGTTVQEGEATSKLEVHYLELPVNITYKIPLPIGNLAIGMGPYTAFGLGGNNRLQVYDAGRLVGTNDYDVGFSTHTNKGIYPGTRLNRWDVGAQVEVGMELSNLFIVKVHYSQGIRNLDLSGNSTIRNHSVGVGLGILLNREDY